MVTARATMLPRNLYTLAAPSSPSDIRYIGRTMYSLRDRLVKHLSDARIGATAGSPIGDWIAELLDQGVKPVITPLEGYASECDAIAAFRAAGYDLLNVGEGGEGREPIPFTEDDLAMLGVASDREVARQVGCHFNTVRRRRVALGIPAFNGAGDDRNVRSAGNQRRFLDCEVRALRRLYNAGKFSAYRMARCMGVSETTVWNILKGRTYADAGGPIAD